MGLLGLILHDREKPMDHGKLAAERRRSIQLPNGSNVGFADYTTDFESEIEKKVEDDRKMGVSYAKLKDGNYAILIDSRSKYFQEIQGVLNSKEGENPALSEELTNLLSITRQQIEGKINASQEMVASQRPAQLPVEPSAAQPAPEQQTTDAPQEVPSQVLEIQSAGQEVSEPKREVLSVADKSEGVELTEAMVHPVSPEKGSSVKTDIEVEEQGTELFTGLIGFKSVKTRDHDIFEEKRLDGNNEGIKDDAGKPIIERVTYEFHDVEELPPAPQDVDDKKSEHTFVPVEELEARLMTVENELSKGSTDLSALAEVSVPNRSQNKAAVEKAREKKNIERNPRLWNRLQKL